jgi:probable phosphoglycerate mutase
MTGPVRAGGSSPARDGATTVLLIRHAATAHTARGLFSGSTGDDPVLSGVGERQAARLAARLAPLPGAAEIVSSPAARAHRTAQILAGACGLPVRVDDDLREIDFGAWEGRTGTEVARDWPVELAAWRAGEPVRVPGGETVAEVAARAAAARTAAVRRHPGGPVVLVSHLYPVRLSVADALGAGHAAIQRMRLEPTGITEIRAGAEGASALVRHNDAAHLGTGGPAGEFAPG